MYLDDDLASIRELNPVHARHAYPVEYHRLHSRPDVAATVRSTSPGLRPAAIQALSTVPRAGATPVGRFPVCRYQAFQAATYGTVISSIRWPVDPISSGGPPGRDRGSSSQSRAV